ncbi:MAG: hypothetical protein ABFQ95_01180 [Pseudomonadota bacterium]
MDYAELLEITWTLFEHLEDTKREHNIDECYVKACADLVEGEDFDMETLPWNLYEQVKDEMDTRNFHRYEESKAEEALYG